MISTHCELLLLRFLMYVNDYGTQWRIVRATLTMPAITDGWSWIRAATVCGCAALYCTVICFVHFSSGPCYLPNFRLVSNSTAANRRVPYYSEKNGPVMVNTWSKSKETLFNPYKIWITCLFKGMIALLPDKLNPYLQSLDTIKSN